MGKEERFISPFKLEDESQYKGRYSPHKIDPNYQPKTKKAGIGKEQRFISPFKLEDESEYKGKYSPHKIDPEYQPKTKGRRDKQ